MTFDEDGNREYETRQQFSVTPNEAGKFVRHLTEGEASVSYNGPAGELSETMPADKAAQYWSDARSSEIDTEHEGELPSPNALNRHLDQYLSGGDLGRIAPAEVTVDFEKPDTDEKDGMGYILETTVEHGDETADLSVYATRTLGRPNNPGEVRKLAKRLDGETSEAFETLFDNLDW